MRRASPGGQPGAGWELERGKLRSLDYFWGILDVHEHKQSIIYKGYSYVESPARDGVGDTGLGDTELCSPLHSRPVLTSRQLYLMWMRPSMSRCVLS